MSKPKSAFDLDGESIWTRDPKMKRLKQGEQYAKQLNLKRGMDYKNPTVHVYTRARKTK